MAGLVDLLKTASGLDGWVASTRQSVRHELYFGARGTDADRRVEEAGARITVYMDRDGRRGRATFDIEPGREAEMERRLADARLQAGLGGQDLWALPPKPDVYPKVVLLDPEARLDAAHLPRRARADIETGVARVPGVRLASAEVFVAKTRTSIVTSSGSAAANDLSDFELTIVLLAGSGAAEQERIFSLSRRRYEDLKLADRVALEARRALDRVEARAPSPGATPVIFGPETIADCLRFLVDGTSARALFQRESPLTRGESIYPGGRCSGEPLVLELNAQFPFGPDSYRIDGDGVAGQNTRVVDGGRFVTPHSDAQYATYLKLGAPTGRPGTPQFPPGRKSETELRGGDHLEVVQFSDLIPARNGAFSAEVRLGYEVRGGVRRAVTGGTVTGNILAGWSAAHPSLEVGLHDGYVGPNLLRIEEGYRVVL